MSSLSRADDLLSGLKLDAVQLGADVAGIIDPTPTSDLVSGSISVARGDYLGGFLSGVSMIPYLGDAIAKPLKGSRLIGKMTSRVDELIELLPALKKEGGAAAELAAKIEKQLEALRGKFCSLPGAKKLCAMLEKQANEMAQKAEGTSLTPSSGSPPSGTGGPPSSGGGQPPGKGGPPSGGDPSKSSSNFVVTEDGVAIPVPQGASGPVPVVNDGGKTTGFAYTGGQGGANGQVDSVRIMDPVPARGKAPARPKGYVVYDNKTGQAVNPITGRTGSREDTHYGLE